jgi:hypothetical protein
MAHYKKFRTPPFQAALFFICSQAWVSSANADVTFDFSITSNGYPFCNCPVNETIEYQQLYSHYQFGSDPLEITGLRFKPQQGGTGAFDPTSLSFTLTLSTTLTNVGSIYGDFANQSPATSFAGNLGVNTVTVFSGPISLSSSGANVFDITIPFTTSYLYDPHVGNLLIGITDISGGVERKGFAAGWSPLMSRFVNSTLGGSTNVFFEASYGLATQFISTTTPTAEPFPPTPPLYVPEPSAPAMLLAGLGMLLVVGRRKSLKTSLTI